MRAVSPRTRARKRRYFSTSGGGTETSGATVLGMKPLRALAGVPLLLLAACTSSGSAECSCPLMVVLVSVPADRIGDVGSVTATGACSNVSPAMGDQYQYYVKEDSVGTCHIVVTFQSGAPEFETDVSLTLTTPDCDCAFAPTSPVVVPELEADGGAAGGR